MGLVADILDRGPSSPSLYVRGLARYLPTVAHDRFDFTLLRNGHQTDFFPAETKLKSHLHPTMHSLYSYFTVSPIRLRKYRFDVIHIPHLDGGGTPAVGYHLVRSPIVFTLHDGAGPLSIPPDQFFANRKRHCLYWCLYSYFRLTYRLLKNRRDILIIMTSESEKRFFQRLVPSYLSDKIRVIYHGVDHSVFKVLSNRAEIEKDIEMRYGVRVPYIFHVSGYQPVKNVRSILQAFCVLKKTYEHDLKLVLAGNTQGHINKLLETARALGLSKELIFTGYVPNKDLPKLYNCAELFVFPSLRESFGLPLLEAMACGTPIVASNRFSIPEIVGGAGILVDPLNASALAKAAHLVLESDEIRKDLTKKGVDRAKTFTWEKCAREHLKIYEEVTCR